MNKEELWNQVRPWLQLYHIRGLGLAGFHKLLKCFTHPHEILSSADSMQKAGISQKLIASISGSSQNSNIKKLLNEDRKWLFLAASNYIICPDSPLYPEILRATDTYPPVLYLKGNPFLLRHPLSISIVGSRSATSSGVEVARYFGTELAKHNFNIVSGMARGIDAAAHYGALCANGSTIAVLGSGIEFLYPKSNLKLAQKIEETGLLLSEFSPDTPPKPGNFPQRNRIISGLSLATLIVEADIRSGSLITARMALEQGRDVMAVPGSIHNPRSKGCHELIRQGAALIYSAEQIIEELQNPVMTYKTRTEIVEKSSHSESDEHEKISPECNISVTKKATPPAAFNNLCSQALFLYEHLSYEATHHDELVLKTKLSSAKVSEIIYELEWHGLIKLVPGGMIRNSCSDKILD